MTIDEDVALLLKQQLRRSGEPLKQTVNRLLRSGLQSAVAPARPKPFVVQARDIGLPKEWTSGSVSELIEMLEGPNHR